METTGDHRLFYQGLIQTAVGFYHLSNENYKGACSQLGKALAKLEKYLPSYRGIDTQRLVVMVGRCAGVAERLHKGEEGRFDETMIPQIEFI